MMRGIPKSAVYLKSTFRAFWRVGLKQDLKVWNGIHGESFWRNARFRTDATAAERRSFSDTLEVHKMGDIIDSSTNQPRSFVNWRSWIDTYYDAGGAPMDEDVVDDLARRMMEPRRRLNTQNRVE